MQVSNFEIRNEPVVRAEFIDQRAIGQQFAGEHDIGLIQTEIGRQINRGIQYAVGFQQVLGAATSADKNLDLAALVVELLIFYRHSVPLGAGREQEEK